LARQARVSLVLQALLEQLAQLDHQAARQVQLVLLEQQAELAQLVLVAQQVHLVQLVQLVQHLLLKAQPVQLGHKASH
jgi:hypothetical protein